MCTNTVRQFKIFCVMKILITIKVLLLSTSWVSCTVGGLTYMDPINFGPYKSVQGEDPCNPLYWYPKSMPDYCYEDKTPKTIVPAPPLKSPAQPIPSIALPYPYPVPLVQMPPLLMPPPIPFTPMLPIPGVPALPMPYQPQQQIGFLPGLPGIVSDDGGINILPFSDAYADLLERHKQKMLIKKYQRIVGDYETFPWKLRSRKGHY